MTETTEHAKLVSLHQGVSWRTRDNRLLLIANMEPGHAARTCGWLERRARAFADHEYGRMLATCHDLSESSFDPIGQALDDMAQNPVGWLRTTALYRALAKRAGAPREVWAG